MANGTMRRYSSLILKEIGIKTIRKYHLINVRMAIIKKTTNSVGEDGEKREFLSTVGGHVNWCSHYGKLTSLVA